MVAPYMADEVKNTFVASAPGSLVVFDRMAPNAGVTHFENIVTPPSSELAAELDSAAEWLGVSIEEILLAALGRTFGRTRGDGSVGVNVVDSKQTSRRVSLLCAAALPMGPTEMLQGAHNSLAAAARPDVAPEIVLDVSGAAAPGAGGCPLELRVSQDREHGALRLDWWYDTARLDPYSVQEMVEQFPLALIEITSDAAAPL